MQLYDAACRANYTICNFDSANDTQFQIFDFLLEKCGIDSNQDNDDENNEDDSSDSNNNGREKRGNCFIVFKNATSVNESFF